MSESLKVSFYGDFTFGENYQAKYDFQEKVSILRQRGYDSLFDNVKHILYGSDYNIVNLETQITNAKNSSLEGKKAVLHWNDPGIAPKMLKKYKIQAVSLGNNHGFDFEDKGLRQSIEALKSEDIEYFGAGVDEDEAAKPLVKQFKIGKRTLNLYVFGGYKYREDYDRDFEFYAKDKKSGINLLLPEKACGHIRKIKENDPDSYVVIFVHFGFDLQKTVPMQKEMARGFVDSGADIVIGHGPHMINQIDFYKSKPLIYSLGNFIFPADFRGKCSPYNLISTLEFSESKKEPEVRLYPVYMENNSKTPKTRLIKEDEAHIVQNLLCEEDTSIKEHLECSNDAFGIYFRLKTK